MKKKLETILKDTIEDCFNSELLSKTPLPNYVIEIPNNPEHGHFATNLPLTLASSQKKPPREIASIVADNIKDNKKVLEKVEIAGPGFINFYVSDNEWYRVLNDILTQANNFGSSQKEDGGKILVEYVSANPTGPLHLGHGRGAALGDTLCRILAFRGNQVVREFYINDAGLQVKLLGESIYSRFKQISTPDYPFPENGYHGDYVLDLSKEISSDTNLDDFPKEMAVELCSRKGMKNILREIKEDLNEFRVDFDVWYSESELHSSGLFKNTLDTMRSKGLLYEEEGALWIRTSDFGDDKDRVIKKSDGQFTYFATDIVYHLEKKMRGFSKGINLWGADHHGYIPRMKGALKAHDFSDDWFSVMLIQLVKLWKGGQEIKMSKRAGTYVTLRELMDEVGVDAVRFVFLTKSHESPLDFDVDLVKKQDSDNPVYYVQYAHARICSIFRKAEEDGLSSNKMDEKYLSLLTLDEEMALIRLMSEFPSLLDEICNRCEPHRLTYYLTDLAAAFHRYFNLGSKIPENRIVVNDRALAYARLFLVGAIRTVIANGLSLLGITAPERM